MKKIFKKLLFAMFSVTLAFSFSACDDDDDEQATGNENKLVGTWEIYSQTFNGEAMTHGNGNIIRINSDYTGSFSDDGQSRNFTWTTSGSNLTLTIGGNPLTYVYEVSGNTLTIKGERYPGGEESGVYVCVLKKKTPSNNNQQGDPALVGKWRAMRQTWNSEALEGHSLIITLNADLTGLVNHNGETENNEFTYRVSDDVLYITVLHGGPGYEFPYRYAFENGHLVLAGPAVPAGGSNLANGDYLGYFEKID